VEEKARQSRLKSRGFFVLYGFQQKTGTESEEKSSGFCAFLLGYLHRLKWQM
jgi:hypothetical protein